MSEAALQGVFSAQGPLARRIGGYRVRAQQIEMARAVAAAIGERATLVCEAGTGTGKTIAYLIPALLSGGKVIVSTGTRMLQDQLFRRDLPLACDALGVPVTAALLKGRANYVCRHHLARALREGRSLPAQEAVADLQRIERFARTSHDGDRGALAGVPEASPAWALATSTRENCLGQSCPDYGECFLMAARRDAMAADVVVVNHHLFFADLALKDEGVAELLPACNTVIFDEAHQLAQTAALFFGETLSSAQIVELARDLRVEGHLSARDMPILAVLATRLDKGARDLRLALPVEAARQAARALRERPGFIDALDRVEACAREVHAAVSAISDRAPELAQLAVRTAEVLERLRRWCDESAAERVQWAEWGGYSVQLNSTPLSVAPSFRRQFDGRPQARIFTSATLAVAGDFTHTCAELGLEGARTGCWDSPFDYASHALLCVPHGLPEPNSPQHTRAVVETALPAIVAAGGRAFMLFTSLRAMRLAYQLMREALAAHAPPLPLLLQGDGSRSELLDRFRSLGNAVLIGSSSFWEGVDVRGDALSLVVIDKLPFASPDDPVLQARIERLQAAGRNAFLEYQLPLAAIALKQGAGRLIRDESDRGALIICDRRVISRGYGRRMLAALPPMRRTREIGDVVAFFRPGAGEQDGGSRSGTGA